MKYKCFKCGGDVKKIKGSYRCPECSKFCWYCGKKSDYDEFCPHCNAPPVKDKWIYMKINDKWKKAVDDEELDEDELDESFSKMTNEKKFAIL